MPPAGAGAATSSSSSSSEPDSEPEPDEEDDGRAYTPVATWKKALITFAAWIRRSCDRAAAATASPRL